MLHYPKQGVSADVYMDDVASNVDWYALVVVSSRVKLRHMCWISYQLIFNISDYQADQQGRRQADHQGILDNKLLVTLYL